MRLKGSLTAYLVLALFLAVLGLGADDADSRRRAPKPDLVVTLMSSASSATPGAKVRVGLVVRNLGRVRARSSQAAVYVSRDRRKSKNDLRLGKTRVGPLRAGQRARKTSTIDVPRGI